MVGIGSVTQRSKIVSSAQQAIIQIAGQNPCRQSLVFATASYCKCLLWERKFAVLLILTTVEYTLWLTEINLLPSY